MADMPVQSDSPQSNIHEYSVSEISYAVKRTVEDAFERVRIRGEVSGYRGPHSSGHAYFTLKDDKSRIDAVIWRGALSKLAFKPEEGLEVIATGRLTTYPGSSKYQIVIDNIEPAGAGALMALLEERRKKLAAEGLFDEARKQLLPALPEVIGVVTSPTGAVIRDIMHRINARYPLHVIVWPVRVQGETSAVEVANAIDGFNRFDGSDGLPKPDILSPSSVRGCKQASEGFPSASARACARRHAHCPPRTACLPCRGRASTRWSAGWARGSERMSLPSAAPCSLPQGVSARTGLPPCAIVTKPRCSGSSATCRAPCNLSPTASARR
jgi:exodeoxyribonuclease VII large subunit